MFFDVSNFCNEAILGSFEAEEGFAGRQSDLGVSLCYSTQCSWKALLSFALVMALIGRKWEKKKRPGPKKQRAGLQLTMCTEMLADCLTVCN